MVVFLEFVLKILIKRSYKKSLEDFVGSIFHCVAIFFIDFSLSTQTQATRTPSLLSTASENPLKPNQISHPKKNYK